jgi:hypothetical protein
MIMPKKTTRQTTAGAGQSGSAGTNGLAARPAAADPSHPSGRCKDEFRLLGYPPALCKACGDHFEYALGLRDGTVIQFAQAEDVDREWVRLMGIVFMRDGRGQIVPGKAFMDGHRDRKETGAFTFDRGIDVRVSEILWLADAPDDS